MAGRPSTYNQEQADEICERLAGGESLRSICQDDLMPPLSVIFQWLGKQPSFAENYTRARQTWADSEFEKMMEIADTQVIGVKTKTLPDGKVETVEGDMTDHRRLQIDTRKWALARMFPKRYGDRQALEHSGPGGTPLHIKVTGVEGKED